MMYQCFCAVVAELRCRCCWQGGKHLDWLLKGYEMNAALSGPEIRSMYRDHVPFRRIFNLGWIDNALRCVLSHKL